jgi:PAS domain S-box-containing protein
MIQQAIPCGEPSSRPTSNHQEVDPTHLLHVLEERLRFESFLARLSTSFINLPAELMDSQIQTALRQLVEFLEIERSSLGQYSEDGGQLVITHSYTIPGFAPFPRGDLAAAWPWYTARIRSGEVLRFTRLPEELPPEAVAERQYCVQSGLCSQLTIPFKVTASVLGAVGFGSFRRERDWSDDLVQSLQLVGEMFANALARKRADIALGESEGRFRLMADTAPVMVWMSGPDKFCTYFNKAWLDFTGRPLHCEVGDGWSESVHPDDLQGCLDTYVRAFDARQEFRMEYRLQRFDRQYRWLLDAGAPRFTSDGTFEGYIGSCIDITDQKRVEEALRESEARLRLLLESTKAIPWVADAESWRFTYVGPQARELLGYPLEAWYGEGFWTNHLHPDDREAAIAFGRDHSRGHTDYDFEYRMIARDGRPVWIQDVVNVVEECGVPKMLRGFMIDVTARRQAEDESRKLRDQLVRVGRVTMMGELAASIAHEINQPLCAIISNAQAFQRMLAGGGFNIEEVREALADITQDGQRASAIINGIRGLLQKAPSEHSPLQLNDLIHEMAALMASEMARRGVAVRLELAKKLPPVLGDRVQLQQVILNLMANGADAMDPVKETASLRRMGSSPAPEPRELIIRSTNGGKGAVTVAVNDGGTGLDPHDLAHIFNPFFTTKSSGMGMGLAICKSIIEAHGGRIWASPNSHRGATFQFTLPSIRDP